MVKDEVIDIYSNDKDVGVVVKFSRKCKIGKITDIQS